MGRWLGLDANPNPNPNPNPNQVAWADGMAAACGRPNAVIGHAPLQRPKEAAAVIGDASP